MQNLSHSSYSFDDFTLDLTRGHLLRDGQEVKLRPKSFEALKFLVENGGRLIGKEELIQALWPNSFVTDGSLVQCLRDVRLALGDDKQRYIKTVPRRGYIFLATVSYSESARGTGQAVVGEEIPVEAHGIKPITFSRGASLWARMRPSGQLWAGLLLMILLAGVLIHFLTKQKASTSGVTIKSIAILPFKPLS